MENTKTVHQASFWLYALAFALALTLRLLRLSVWPLTDEEARWAMQAFDLLKGLQPEIGEQAGYVLLTTLVFYVAQAGEFTARFVPALFGALLVWAPYFFRDRLGEKTALTLAFLLVFEPGLLALSKLAGSPMMAVSMLMLAWGAWRMQEAPAAGVLAGFALLSGPQLWPGLIGLGLTYGLTRRLAPEALTKGFNREGLSQALAYAVGTFLVVGSLFLWAPGGLGAGLRSLPAYLSTWLAFNEFNLFDLVPAKRLLLALIVYQFPALILAIVCLVRNFWQRNDLTIALGLWLLTSLILALANPGRQVFDLAWALLPLWTLAALEVGRHLIPLQDNAWETLGMMALTVVLLGFAGLTFSSIALLPMPPEQAQRYILLLGTSLALLGVTVFMVAYGWSVTVATQGGLWGALVMLAIASLSTSLAAGGLRVYQTAEMWPPGLPAPYAGYLSSQLDEIYHWKLSPAQPLSITVAGITSPALRWTLRDTNATFSDAAAFSKTPDALIIPANIESPELQANYRGQDFTWRTQAYWDLFTPADWLRWIFHHQATEGQEVFILWVRSDLFPDYQNLLEFQDRLP